MDPSFTQFSLNQLLDIVRNYWPSKSEFIPIQHTSPERERFQDLWERRRENLDPWNAFLKNLKVELPNFVIGNIVTTIDASLRCMIYPGRDAPPGPSTWVVVGCVSILAPVYAIYGVSYDSTDGKRSNFMARFEPPPPSMSAPARIVARAIEQAFGASVLPREVTQTPVPLFVELKEPPETTLFDALFTSEPSSIL